MENYQKEIVNGIIEILKTNPILPMSWGMEKLHGILYENMPALIFHVNGFIHKGHVVIAYNEGSDLYQVYALNKHAIPIRTEENIYFDELMDIIDRMVEKDCTDNQYNLKCEQFLKKTSQQ